MVLFGFRFSQTFGSLLLSFLISGRPNGLSLFLIPVQDCRRPSSIYILVSAKIGFKTWNDTYYLIVLKKPPPTSLLPVSPSPFFSFCFSSFSFFLCPFIVLVMREASTEDCSSPVPSLYIYILEYSWNQITETSKKRERKGSILQLFEPLTTTVDSSFNC